MPRSPEDGTMKSEANRLLVASVQHMLDKGQNDELTEVINSSHSADLAFVFNFLDPEQRSALFCQNQGPR